MSDSTVLMVEKTEPTKKYGPKVKFQYGEKVKTANLHQKCYR
jgi:hypothetical protein